MALPATEDFTTGTDFIELATHNPKFTQRDGALNLRSATDDLYASDGGKSFYYWNDDVFDDNQYVELVYKAAGSQSLGCGLRMVAGGSIGDSAA